MAQLRPIYLFWVMLSGVLWALPGFSGAAELSAPLKPVAFLVGRWEGAGAVSDTGSASRGVSTITVEADGHALLRNDRTTVSGRSGQPDQSFGQTMLIYAEADGVRADYVDGEGHVIHYGPAKVAAGHSAEFTSIGPAGAPVFRLRYEAEGPDALKIAFMIRPPGAADFSPIAVGRVSRSR